MFSLRNNHILQAIVAAIILLLIWVLKDVFILFFIAFLVTTFLHPTVNWLNRHHVPIGFAVMLPILGTAIIIAALVYFATPQVANESKQFANQLPNYAQELKDRGLEFNINTSEWQTAVKDHFGTISDVLIGASKVAAEVLIGLVSVIVVTLYWLGSYNRVQQTVLSFFPKTSRDRVADIWARIEKKLVSWVVAQIMLGIVVGVLVWIGALIIGLPFAGILGLIAGLLEIIPTLGPIAAAIPAVLLALTISVQTAVWAIVVYIIVQQIENHLLAPVLLGKTVHLSPIIVIFSLLVGATLYGIIGALLAVPIALVISSFVDSYRDGKPTMKPSSIKFHFINRPVKKSVEA